MIRTAVHESVSLIERAIASGYRAKDDRDVIRNVKRDRKLWITTSEAHVLMSIVKSQSRLNGVMAEVGVCEGGSASLICECKGATPLHLFDTFNGLPAPSSEDKGFFEEKMFPGQLKSVQEYLAKYKNVSFHPGHFPKTAKKIESERFSFVFLDVDLYESTKDSLEFFWPRMSPGGILLSHDFQFPGVRQAFHDAGHSENVIELANSLSMIVAS